MSCERKWMDGSVALIQKGKQEWGGQWGGQWQRWPLTRSRPRIFSIKRPRRATRCCSCSPTYATNTSTNLHKWTGRTTVSSNHNKGWRNIYNLLLSNIFLTPISYQQVWVHQSKWINAFKGVVLIDMTKINGTCLELVLQSCDLWRTTF